MDAEYGGRWDKDDRVYSSDSCSDDSPVLSRRYDRRQYSTCAREGKEERERRPALSVLAKFFVCSAAVILFCVLMYIPVYNRANYQMPKGIVQGWSISRNRDTKLYVQPNNVTALHEPTDVCNKLTNKHTNNNKLFLLIVVCSSTVHFERRLAIRETWGRYKTYLKNEKIFRIIKERYKNYNYTDDLYPNESEKLSLKLKLNHTHEEDNVTAIEMRTKRDINGFSELLPELARAIKKNLDDTHNKNVKVVEEKRFDNVEDEPMLPEFDMNEVMGDERNENTDYDYNYESNIMRIPPKGEREEEEEPSLEKILNLIKESSNLEESNKLEENKKLGESLEELGNIEREFKLVFLLGLPPHDNSSKIQNNIEEEVKEYGDIIQEGFIDSYNNLTLKSIMMLKWITNNCNDSVRYILKTDDDMYLNMPNLMQNLKNRSRIFDAKKSTADQKEYLLIGDLITGARPVLDVSNKWYSPRYMYSGRIYPRYVSGTAYVFSADAGRALYKAALTTTYFHLEDIYITGMCSVRATPTIIPRDEPLFSYRAAPRDVTCYAHARAAAHRLHPQRMRVVATELGDQGVVDRCERVRLTQVRRERMRPKTTARKKLTKLPIN